MIRTDQALAVPIVEQHQGWPSIDRYLVLKRVSKRIPLWRGVEDRQQSVSIACERGAAAGRAECLGEPATGPRCEHRATPHEWLRIGQAHGEILSRGLRHTGA